MFLRNTRAPLIASILTLWVLSLAPSCSAGGHEPLQRAGRWLGAGWGDGYHSCADSGCRPGANLPPRSYHKQFNQSSKQSFYDRFDAGTRCQACGGPAGHCSGGACCSDPCSGDACRGAPGSTHCVIASRPRTAKNWMPSFSGTGHDHSAAPDCDDIQCDTAVMSERTELQRSAEISLAPPTVRGTPNDTSLSPKTTMQFASDHAPSPKRPIRPLPPIKRQTTSADSISEPGLPRPIRPQPPARRVADPGSSTMLPVMTVPVAPAASDLTLPSERKIVEIALDAGIEIPGFDTQAAPTLRRPIRPTEAAAR